MVQPQPNGIAAALRLTLPFVDGDDCALYLGDNIIHVDFTRVNLEEEVTVKVQLHFVGTPKEAMVFDSSSPTGNDVDLGTPNESFGGPGVGRKGVKGRLFENDQTKGNLLIVSEDGDGSDPDDDWNGGVLVFEFDPPRSIDSVGLVDNEEGSLFEVTVSDGSSTFV